MNKDQNISEKKIIFISSYPKSGNTWVRIVLSSLLNKKRGLFELKNLEEIKLFSQFVYFSHFENLKYQSNGNLDALCVGLYFFIAFTGFVDYLRGFEELLFILL